jgi:hypothetical protein
MKIADEALHFTPMNAEELIVRCKRLNDAIEHFDEALSLAEPESDEALLILFTQALCLRELPGGTRLARKRFQHVADTLDALISERDRALIRRHRRRNLFAPGDSVAVSAAAAYARHADALSLIAFLRAA